MKGASLDSRFLASHTVPIGAVRQCTEVRTGHATNKKSVQPASFPLFGNRSSRFKSNNVPLNNQLAAVSASDRGAIPVWEHYLDRWTLLKTIRTIAAIAAVTLFTVGLLMQDGSG